MLRLLSDAVVRDVLAGVELGVIATRFHRAVADIVLSISLKLKAQTGLSAVALSGGVFQNVTAAAANGKRLLHEAGFTVYYHHQVPPNDGGLALGQAIIAAASHI